MIPFRKSLGFRILVIFFILLCLPVLVDSFVLLNQSFKEGVSDAKNFLMEKSVLRKQALSELVPSQSPIVELLANHLKLKEFFPESPSPELNEELASLTQHGNFSSIVLLKKTGSKYTVLGSSLGQDIGKDNTEFIESIAEGPFGFTFIFIAGDQKYYFVNAYHFYSKENELLGILLVYTDISEKLNSMVIPDVTRFPIFFSILLENSLVFTGSDSKLNMNYFTELKPEEAQRILLRIQLTRKFGFNVNNLAKEPLTIKEGNDFPFIIFNWNGEDWIGYISQLGKTHYYLLSYVSKNAIYKEIFSRFFHTYGTYALILLLGGLSALLITKRLTRPLTTLTSTMDQLKKGNTQVRAPDDPLGFEINTLSLTFNDMISNLLEKEKIAEEEKLKWVLYKKELNLGEQVQRRLFVEKKAIPESVEIATHYLPALEVAGDFCDRFMQKDNLVLMIADGAGKGVEACIYSLIVRSYLRSFCKKIDNVSLVMQKTHDLFLKDIGDSGFFVTAVLGFYNPQNRRLTYYCAGHNLPIVRRKDGSIELLKLQGGSLGFELISHNNPSAEIYLNPGDTIVFYTDGITEAHNERKKLFTEERLIEVIKKEGDKGAEELLHKIIQAVTDFENGELQYDDITLMIMKVKDA